MNLKDSGIKGRLAEAIVEELFLAMGYQVFRFGMENTIPGFGNRHLPKKGKVAKKIRRMPDFVVVKDKETHFIEVKYRKSGEFDFNSYYKDGYPYPNAIFILISPKHIKAQKVDKLQNGTGFTWLTRIKEFDTNKDKILKFLEFSKKYFFFDDKANNHLLEQFIT